MFDGNEMYIYDTNTNYNIKTWHGINIFFKCISDRFLVFYNLILTKRKIPNLRVRQSEYLILLCIVAVEIEYSTSIKNQSSSFAIGGVLTILW